MSTHPLTLTIRFLVELAALMALAYAGWTQNTGILQVLIGVGAPMLAAVMWGVFRYPNDPGKPPVQVSGAMRLLLEAVYFTAAVIALAAASQPAAAAALGIVTLVNYGMMADRVRKMLANQPLEGIKL